MTPHELATARRELRLSADSLARLMGVTRSTVWRWEHARSMVPEPCAMLIRALAADRSPRLCSTPACRAAAEVAGYCAECASVCPDCLEPCDWGEAESRQPHGEITVDRYPMCAHCAPND